MRPTLCLCLAATMSCATRSTEKPLDLDALILAWAGTSTPVCGASGTPAADGLGSGLPGAMYCRWDWMVAGSDSARLGAERMERDGFYFADWNRRFRDSSGVAALRDSLARALRSSGLQERECRNGGRRWETANLGVEFTPNNLVAGMWVAMVFATTKPDEIPSLYCPARPAAPNASD